MAGELAKRGTAAVAVRGGSALKKAAKKAAGKKAPGKKAAKKAPGKKGAKHEGDPGAKKLEAGGARGTERAFHHLQRASAVISLVEGDSGGDLRMLLEEGVAAYGRVRGAKGVLEALGLLRAAEHLGMAGLYAARVSHRLDVKEPEASEVEKMLDRVGVRLDAVGDVERRGFAERLPAMAAELLSRAEAADHDPHLAWELVMAAEGLCFALEAMG